MSMKHRDEDAENESAPSPYADLRKNVVLRDARIFNDRELNPHRCAQVLTNLLYLSNQGESLTSEEATEVFFAVTKLFQSPDILLRRLIYLMIKELRVESDSSLIVVSCLSKDMTSKNDLFRAHSIRVLAQIMDTSMVQQMERFLKQAIVDRNPYIMSSALCSAQHIAYTAPDVVKRWVNETTEALSSRNKMVQYHALCLLYRLRGNDKLATSKLISSLTRLTPSVKDSPLAQVLLVRMIGQVLRALPDKPVEGSPSYLSYRELIRYLTDCIMHRSYLVMFEAAQAMLKQDHLLSPGQLIPSISVIQEMLTSSIATYRFAAIKALSAIANKYPVLVAPCVVDLENCMNDSNRTIATMAMTTLLKTGAESNIDRLIKMISGFMTDISDDFKINIIEAIQGLCLKFPHKFPALLNFLSTALREEGGFKYKKSIVDSVLHIIGEIREATELGLEQFCEFIEDSEFPELSVRILHVLGERGPATSNPAKYIRFIFNRVILETACVRCAAIASLAKFGAAVPTLTEHILVLLQRCLTDNDDEVRDRAIFHIAALSNETSGARVLSVTNSKQLPSPYQVEQSLVAYLSKGDFSQPFSLQRDLVGVAEPEPTQSARDTTSSSQVSTSNQPIQTNQPTSQAGAQAVNPHLELLRSIPELATLGPIFKSCAPVSLTEPESEYVVSCIKHILNSHVVFQFNVTNTLENQQLENVRVEMECENGDWEEELAIPETKLQYSIAGVTFVAFKRAPEAFVSGPINCTLHFMVRDVDEGEVVDPDGEGQPDEYQLEEIEVAESDFMISGENLGFTEFKRQWEELGEQGEVVKKYSLGLDNLQSAVTAVIDLLGMQPCEQSSTVQEGANSHAVNLTGMFFKDVKVLARAGFKLDPKHGVTLKIVVRSPNDRVNQMLTNAIR